MKFRKSIYNIIFAPLGQIIIVALGILVPRFILKNYGDETNGLIGAISQMFIYLNLIESGVGQAALQALFHPISKNDFVNSNKILSATSKYYKRLSKTYVIVVLIFAVVFPLLINVKNPDSLIIFGDSYLAIFLIILIQGMSNVVGFYFSETLKQVFIADGRNYIIVNITTFMHIIISIAKIILINSGVNIVILQLVYFGVAMIEFLVYRYIICKRYPWINTKDEQNSFILHQRRPFVVHEITNVIFNSTDILVLSIFCSLEIASIYIIYSLVFSSLNGIMSQLHNGLFFVLGHSYNENSKDYPKVHDMYDTYFTSLGFGIITVAYLLMNYFIVLYTKGLNGVNYYDKYLPMLFALIQLLSISRITSSSLIKLSGHIKQTIPQAIIEASINLTISIILVQIIGIYGVLIGTIISLLYRSSDMIIYSNKKILVRNPIKTFRISVVNFSIFFIISLISSNFKFVIPSFNIFFLYGLSFTIIFPLIYIVFNSIFNIESAKTVITILKREWNGRYVGSKSSNSFK